MQITPPFKKKLVTAAAILALAGGLGISMPNCGGGKELEALKTENGELSKKIATLESQASQLNADMDQVKKILPQMNQILVAQKQQIESLEASAKTKGKGSPTKAIAKSAPGKGPSRSAKSGSKPAAAKRKGR